MPLELGCVEASYLSCMDCKVSAIDRPDVGIGKRRGRQVTPLGANGCLVVKVVIPPKNKENKDSDEPYA